MIPPMKTGLVIDSLIPLALETELTTISFRIL